MTLALFVGICWWFSAMEPKQLTVTNPREHQSGESLEYVHSPSGRVLNVVVEDNGIYIDEQRVDFAQAKEAISGILKDRGIRNLKLFATDTARWGALVELYAAFPDGAPAWKNFSLRPVATGTRLPSIGFLKRYCCTAEDVVLLRHWGIDLERDDFHYVPLDEH